MTSAYDVPAKELIPRLEDKLKEYKEIVPPDWAPYVKTGTHKERVPVNKDWWYTRTAALLRKVYVNGPIGLSKLKAEYGGKKDMGSKPYHAVKGSGSIIRIALHQLESCGLVEAQKGKGRLVTSEGRKVVDGVAHETLKKIIGKYPELGKY